MKSVTINVSDEQYETVVEFLSLLPSIEILNIDAGNSELLKRKSELDSGRIESISIEEVFDV